MKSVRDMRKCKEPVREIPQRTRSRIPTRGVVDCLPLPCGRREESVTDLVDRMEFRPVGLDLQDGYYKNVEDREVGGRFG